jgi:hypothetical protein
MVSLRTTCRHGLRPTRRVLRRWSYTTRWDTILKPTGIMAPMSLSLLEAWNAYIVAEARGIRREYLPALDTFLDALSACTEEERALWVSQFFGRWSTGKETLPLRGPLLERAVLPHLATEFRNGSAHAAQQLAELYWTHGSHRSWNQLKLPSRIELLEEAYRRNPSSDEIRKKLLNHHLSYVQYTLHELPMGVLIGINGANADECTELEAFLDEVTQLMHPSERVEYEALFSDARFHYRTYRDYLQQSDRCGYEAYLARIGQG